MFTPFFASRSIHRAWIPLYLIAVLIASGCGGGGDSSPDTTPTVEKIVFVSDDEGFRGINTISPDGTGRELLSTETGVGYIESASFSPDGSKIAFLSNRDDCGGVGCQEGDFGPDYPMQIWLINGDGTGLRQLTRSKAWQGAGAPMFSRDGSRVLYNAFQNGEYALHSVSLDGGNDTVLARGKEMRDMSLSPDGSKIVFSGDRDGNDSVFTYEIYVMNVDGSGETRLTANALLESNPTFSPDGSRIVYCRYDTVGLGNVSEIYVMNADGARQTRLTDDSAYDFSPSFSPDGTNIVFYSTRDSGGAGLADATATRVFVMNADGTDQHPIPARPGLSPYSVFFDSVSPHHAWGRISVR